MKSLIASTAAAALLSSSFAYAGNLADPIVEPRVERVLGEEAIAAETVSSAGGSVLIPLLAIAVLGALATSGGSGGGALAPVMMPAPAPVKVSDARLKTDITRIGTLTSGLPVYEFRYKGLAQKYQGVMAQDVLKHSPDAVVTAPGGFLAVDYNKLGLKLRKVR